jgi:DNA-binding response OmpR family regulator
MTDQPVSRSGIVLALPADLIFGARIRATAESVGAATVIARDPGDLLSKLSENETRMIILDLDRRGLAITDTIKAIKAISPVSILAYVAHTNENAIREARDAGADKVIARGAFAHQLADLLKLF